MFHLYVDRKVQPVVLEEIEFEFQEKRKLIFLAFSLYSYYN